MQDSYDIANSWLEALASSVPLAAFCQERFNKNPTVVLGERPGEKHGEDEAPFVLIIPVHDKGGYESDQSQSTALVVLGLKDRETVSVGAYGTRERGYESQGLFEGVVLACLADTDFPPSHWEGQTAQPSPWYFERYTFLEIIQTRTIG